MTSWIISIGVVTIITTLLTTILPEKENLGIVKFVLSLLTILVVVSPLLSKDSTITFSFENVKNTSVNVQKNFLDYYVQKKVEYIENECNIICNEEGITILDVTVEYENNNNEFTLKKINIYYKNTDEKMQEEFLVALENAKKRLNSIYTVDIMMVNSNE